MLTHLRIGLIVTATIFVYSGVHGMQSLQSVGQSNIENKKSLLLAGVNELQVFNPIKNQTDLYIKVGSLIAQNPIVNCSNFPLYQIVSPVNDSTRELLQRKRKKETSKEKLPTKTDIVNAKLLALFNQETFKALSEDQLLGQIILLSKNVFPSQGDRPKLVTKKTSIYDYVSYIVGNSIPILNSESVDLEEVVVLPKLERCLPLGIDFLHSATCVLLFRNTIIDNKIKWLNKNNETCIFNASSIAFSNLKTIIDKMTNLISIYYTNFVQKFRNDCNSIIRMLNNNNDLFECGLLLEKIKEILIDIDVYNKKSWYRNIRVDLDDANKWNCLQQRLNSWIFSNAKHVVGYSDMLKQSIIRRVEESNRVTRVNTILIPSKKCDSFDEKKETDKEIDKGQGLNDSFFANLNNSVKILNNSFYYNQDSYGY